MTPALVVPVLGRKLYPGASVALDFTRNLYRSGTPVVKGSPSLLSGWTFTRASTGYAETAAGALTSFASGAPRITDKGLLVEEARTNLLLRSQEFDNASWTKLNATVTANAAAAPDGTVTADALIEDTATGVHTVLPTVFPTISSGASYTISIYAKANGRTLLLLRDNGTSSTGAVFSLAGAGSVTNTEAGVTTATITAITNGWYRCAVTYTSGATSANVQPRLVSTGTTVSYTGDGTSGVYLWGAQFELGAFPTSYIPTTTASATRAADSATISGLTVASLHTLYSEVTHLTATSVADRYAVLSNGANERTYLGRSSGGLIQGFTTAGGVTPSSSAISGAITTGTYKAGVSVGSTTFVAARSGLLGTAQANSPPSGLSLLTIGGEPTSVSPMNGYIRTLALYPYAFTDAALQALTA